MSSGRRKRVFDHGESSRPGRDQEEKRIFCSVRGNPFLSDSINIDFTMIFIIERIRMNGLKRQWQRLLKKFKPEERTVASGSHETRLSLLEASISDLKEQVLLVFDIWAGFDDNKSTLASHTTDMEIIAHEARSTRHHYNNTDYNVSSDSV
ncbi:hypothetical protein CJ030_MR2G022055 [Morella rubra]|uniref:Uncharacterized protein n=1 Tax=Morella rubra TaxID=262757 RepID=A0A6A1WIJ1_9ROSI|nr:hypothetical protein CJ030_MR2G022055 [Morella rubra]